MSFLDDARFARARSRLRSGLSPFVVLLPLCVLFWTKPAHAYAWLIKHGYGGCPVCHADPSGGELLTMYGRVQGNLLLRMQYGENSNAAEATEGGTEDFDSFDDFGDFEEPGEDKGTDEGEGKTLDQEEGAPKGNLAPGSEDAAIGEDVDEGDEDKGKEAEGKEPASEEAPVGFLWGRVATPDNLLLGGSFRNLIVYRLGSAGDPLTFIPIMMGDLYMQLRAEDVRAEVSTGITKAREGSPHGRAAMVTRAGDNKINMISRTHWIGFDLGANDEYLLRFGRINLPFGVRIPEHTMWAREATRTDRESDQQHGVALSYNGDEYRGEAMVILGNYQVNPDKYRQRGYSFFAEYFPNPKMAVGVSSLLTWVLRDPILLEDRVTRQAHGLMARVTLLEYLTALAEVDLLSTTGYGGGYTGFAQFDYEAVQGLHLMFTPEFLNSGAPKGGEATPGAGQMLFGAWGTVAWYFYNQFEFRVDYLYRQETDPTILAQLHFYL